MLLHILTQVPYLRPLGGQLYTVLAELYANALEHGVLALDSGLKDSPEGFARYYGLRETQLAELQQGSISFDIYCCGDSERGQLSIDVEDSGAGFDYRQYGNSRADRGPYSGRGITLLRGICQEVAYSGNGNTVRVSIAWPPEST